MCTLTHTIKTNARRIFSIIILIFKLLKIFEMPLLFRELLVRKTKKIDVGAHKKGK